MNITKQKTRKTLIILLFAVMSTVGIALAGPDNLTGTVIQSENGLILKTNGENYLLAENTIARDFIGKKVRINGTISSNEAGKSITIDFIEELEN